MTHDPVILRSGDPVAVAIHKMAVGGFRHVPIVKGGVTGRGRIGARRVPAPRRRPWLRPAPGDSRAVVVLADDLIWATRLGDAIRAAGATPRPSAASRTSRRSSLALRAAGAI